MNFTGKVTSIIKDWKTGQLQITFSINEASAMAGIDEIKDAEVLDISAKKYRKHRSLDANAMLWACIGEISNVTETDKWQIYLDLLKHYGKYTYIVVKENAVESVKASWRECEEIGKIDINGTEGVQMLCYFGSSTYNTKEFSKLLNGCVDEFSIPRLKPWDCRVTTT